MSSSSLWGKGLRFGFFHFDAVGFAVGITDSETIVDSFMLTQFGFGLQNLEFLIVDFVGMADERSVVLE